MNKKSLLLAPVLLTLALFTHQTKSVSPGCYCCCISVSWACYGLGEKYVTEEVIPHEFLAEFEPKNLFEKTQDKVRGARDTTYLEAALFGPFASPVMCFRGKTATNPDKKTYWQAVRSELKANPHKRLSQIMK